MEDHNNEQQGISKDLLAVASAATVEHTEFRLGQTGTAHNLRRRGLDETHGRAQDEI
jgi:hypothetical protein